MKNYIVPLALIIAICGSSLAQAQDRTKRREFIGDLLKGLLESQLDKNNNPRGDVYPGQYPGQYPPGQRVPVQPRSSGRPIKVAVAPEMLNIRKGLNNWNATTAELVAELRHHESESPQLRSMLADSLQFQANVTAVSRRAQLMPNYQTMTNDFVALDRDWRVLSTRLKQTRGLPRECMGMIKTISDLDTQLCGLFQVQPQLDRAELGRLATMLANDYDHLLRGVYFSARGKRGSEQLLKQGQALQTMIGQASSLINRGDYETIVGAYKKCTNEWRSFSQQVLRLNDERLRYSVQHIEDTGRKLQEQLWLPVELDRSYLASLSDSINADATQVFNSVTLAQLLATKQPGNLLAMSRELQAACTNFSRQLNGGTAEDQLEWGYRLFASKWNRFHDEFHKFNIPAVDHRLEDIEFSMNALAEVFGNDIAIGHDELVHIYSEMDALCKQASLDIHRRITNRRYDEGFHDQLCGLGDSLSRSVYNLHRASLMPNYRPTAEQLQPVFQNWATMRPLLAKCKPDDRNYFNNNFRKQIEPIMVKLQVMYSN